MSRETPHEKFPSQALLDLAANRPFRTQTKDGHLHVCVDKKLTQNAFNNFLLSHTPYRCSLLGKSKAMETKTRRAKRTSKVHISADDMSSTYVTLPKIPLSSESLIGKNGQLPEHSARQEVSEDRKDPIKFVSDEEESACDFLSCGSVKIAEQIRAMSPRPSIRDTTRSRSLPLILSRRNSSCYSTSDAPGTHKSIDKFQGEDNYTSKKKDGFLCHLRHKSSNDEFTRVMEDGAKVTVNQHRISIEVFMPRTS